MALSDAEIERYARHVIVPGVGASGQERISRSRLAVFAAPDAETYLLAYARAAGFQVSRAVEPAPDCAIAAGLHALDSNALTALRELHCPIVWYAFLGARLVGGRLARGGALPAAPQAAPPPDPAMNAPAAADAVASAIAMVLGWTDVETEIDVDLS